jgi:hypothetical protein
MSVKQVFNTSAELDYPTVLPTLDLDFANSKTLDPRITFTRASGGSYVGADGLIKLAGVNEPRFDHNPYTGESLGFLVEESRTNLSIYSEDFSNTSYWGPTSQTVVSNVAISPNGDVTADNIIPAAGTNALRYLYYAINPYSMSASTPYTSSVFVKKNGLRYFAIQAHDNFMSSGHRAGFDLDNGIVVASTVNNTGSATGATASIVPYPNGWYRCIITGTTAGTGTIGGTAFSFTSSLDANASVGSISADGTSGGFIWGMQVEQGAFPTSYIPTTSATVTRAADNASIGSSATWFNPSGFTVVSDCQGSPATTTTTNTGSGYPYIFSFGQQIGNRLVGVRSAGGPNGSWSLYSQPPGIFAYSTNANFNSVRKHKVAAAYNLLDYLPVADGIIGTSITPAADPTLFVNFYLGRGDDGGFWGGTISRLTYYPKRLTNQQLQVLTT